MSEDKQKIIARLKRIEGQVRGLERMLGNGNDCLEVLTQLSAVSAALKKAGLEIVKIHMGECLSGMKEGKSDDLDRKSADLKEILARFLSLA
ncbi:MAG: metal-sensitive transcriptional regulator [Smithellaceae bacterium]|nr:metal-sensitive transcriptional regulator [Smithellaceae bacterium]